MDTWSYLEELAAEVCEAEGWPTPEVRVCALPDGMLGNACGYALLGVTLEAPVVTIDPSQVLRYEQEGMHDAYGPITLRSTLLHELAHVALRTELADDRYDDPRESFDGGIGYDDGHHGPAWRDLMWRLTSDYGD